MYLVQGYGTLFHPSWSLWYHRVLHRPSRPTETALLRVQNDVLCTLSGQKPRHCVVDPSGFICTVWPRVPPSPASASFFHLQNRETCSLLAGVRPHGTHSRYPDLGALCFRTLHSAVWGSTRIRAWSDLVAINIVPVENMLRRHWSYQGRVWSSLVLPTTDDVQLDLCFDPDGVDSAVKRFESCIAEVELRGWGQTSWCSTMRRQRLSSSQGGPNSCHLSPHYFWSETVVWVFAPAASDLGVILDSITIMRAHGQTGRRPVQRCSPSPEQRRKNLAHPQWQGSGTVGACLRNNDIW